MTANNKDDQTDLIESLKLALDDLKRLFDHLSKNYDSIKNRVLALIAGEVAIATFVFSAPTISASKLTIAEKIFYFSSIGILGLSFLLLVWIISTASWKIPLNLADLCYSSITDT